MYPSLRWSMYLSVCLSMYLSTGSYASMQLPLLTEMKISDSNLQSLLSSLVHSQIRYMVHHSSTRSSLEAVNPQVSCQIQWFSDLNGNPLSLPVLIYNGSVPKIVPEFFDPFQHTASASFNASSARWESHIFSQKLGLSLRSFPRSMAIARYEASSLWNYWARQSCER